MIQSGKCFGRPFGPLLAKSVLIPLALTAAASIAEAGMYKKLISSATTILITSND